MISGATSGTTGPAKRVFYTQQDMEHTVGFFAAGISEMQSEGEYGELVITTIEADDMPLICYRTGDFPRILPPCPCGGVTKRLDTVSRREGAISIEALDSIATGENIR